MQAERSQAVDGALPKDPTSQPLRKEGRHNSEKYSHLSPLTMSTAPHTSTSPTSETPSSSETGGKDLYADDNVSSGEGSNQEAKPGQSEVKHGSAEEAAEKLYKERIEGEYAKREGGA